MSTKEHKPEASSQELEKVTVPVSWLVYLLRNHAIYQEQATTDPLTGLLNRRGFEKIFNDHREGFPRNLSRDSTIVPGSVLHIDGDKFKSINDNLGHATGDLAIKYIADTLSANVRPMDYVARLGGDEFAVFLPQASEEEGLIVGNHLVEAMRSSRAPLPSDYANLTISVGVAPIEAYTLDDNLSLADRGLYAAKHLGGNQAVSLSQAVPA